MLYAPEQFRNLRGRQHHQVSMDIIAENDLSETVSRFSKPSL
jgi:histidyl-tRNA synthetase